MKVGDRRVTGAPRPFRDTVPKEFMRITLESLTYTDSCPCFVHIQSILLTEV